MIMQVITTGAAEAAVVVMMEVLQLDLVVPEVVVVEPNIVMELLAVETLKELEVASLVFLVMVIEVEMEVKAPAEVVEVLHTNMV